VNWTPQPFPTPGLDYRPPALGQTRTLTQGGASGSQRPPLDRTQGGVPLRSRILAVTGSGDAQAVAKVRLLGARVVAPALDPTSPTGLIATRRLLAEALQGAPRRVNGHHKALEAVRIFEWVKGRIRYVNDPVGVELFTAVPEVFARGYGDCDDYTAVLAALLMAAGIPAKARIIQHRNAPGWSHIYPVAHLDGAWRALDATVEWHQGRRVRAGWEYPDATRRQDVELV
jgi:transglutaminase-like putative cysteine protease